MNFSAKAGFGAAAPPRLGDGGDRGGGGGRGPRGPQARGHHRGGRAAGDAGRPDRAPRR